MGIIAAFLCTLSLTARDLTSKRLSFSVASSNSAFGSFLFALPYYAVLLAALGAAGYEDFSGDARFWQLVVLRSLTDAAAESLKMYALLHGDISLVTCFFAFNPVILLFLSPVVTGDAIPLGGVVGVLIIVFGTIVFVLPEARGRGERDRAKRAGTARAIAATLVASIFFSLNQCLDRLAVQHASPAFSAATMTVLAGLFVLPFALRSGRLSMDLRTAAGPFFLRGFFEVGFMVLKLLAMRTMQAPYVVAIQKLSLLFAILGGWLLFGERELGRKLLAGCIILTGVLIIVGVQLR